MSPPRTASKSEQNVSDTHFRAIKTRHEHALVRWVPERFCDAVASDLPELADPELFPTLCYLCFGSNLHRDERLLQLSALMLAAICGSLTPTVVQKRSFPEGSRRLERIRTLLGSTSFGEPCIRIRPHRPGFAPRLLEWIYLPLAEASFTRFGPACSPGVPGFAPSRSPVALTFSLAANWSRGGRASVYDRFSDGGFKRYHTPRCQGPSASSGSESTPQPSGSESTPQPSGSESTPHDRKRSPPKPEVPLAAFGPTLEVRGELEALAPNAFTSRIHKNVPKLLLGCAVAYQRAAHAAERLACESEREAALRSARQRSDSESRCLLGLLLGTGTPRYVTTPRSARVFPVGGAHPALLRTGLRGR